MKWCGHYTRVSSVVLSLALTCLMGTVLVGCPPPPVTPPVEEVIPPPQTLAPGLSIVVEKVTIPADLRPEVIFEIQDGDGNDIALAELAEARFILAYLGTPEAGSTARWLSYTLNGSGDQATTDSAQLGGITRNNDGTFTYKFDTVLPADYDAAAPHQLSGQIARTYPVDGLDYPVNPLYRFIPSGAAAKQIAGRDIVNTETCNTCHTRLELHGGDRREIQYCIMCHNTQSTDPESGNSVDMAQMIHKIHMGEELPSVQAGEPYQIIGYRNSLHDYSEVVFPQDVRNCTVCHQGEADSDVFVNAPTLEGCASCHDRTWFGSGSAPEGYEAHIGGAQDNNALCSACHKPDAIAANHVTPANSSANPGLVTDILDVVTTPVEGGFSLAITIQVTEGDGTPINDVDTLSRLRALVAWPATDYQQNQRESIAGGPDGTLVANGNGVFVYTFETVFPMTADTFVVGLEARIEFELNGESERQGTTNNGLTFFTADGSDPVARRMVVDDAKCNVCHDDLRFHGDSRFGAQYCLLCHNVNLTEGDDVDSVAVFNFKELIHEVHEAVPFPGHLNDCGLCHVDGSTDLPLPATNAATNLYVDDELVGMEQPTSGACTSCHADLLVEIHAAVMTDPATGIESCAVCHGPGTDFAVSDVHALAP